MDGAAPRLSICMPVRNGAAQIERAIASALGQSFRDFELLVSENGSTDDTAAVVERAIAGDPRARLIRQTEPLDVMRNFGAALAEARGNYVVFLAHDDWWEGEFLAPLMALADADPTLELLAPRACRVDPDGRRELRPAFPRDLGTGLGRTLKLLRLGEADWFYGIYRRTVLQRTFALIADYDLVWGWDHIVQLPCLLSGRVEGSDAAITCQLSGGAGTNTHRPHDHASARRAFGLFLDRALRILRAVEPSPLRRALLTPYMVRFANQRAWKLRRLARSWMQERLRPRRAAGTHPRRSA